MTETPHPPATAEFGHVVPGGPTHGYEPAGGLTVKKLSVGPYDNNVYVVEAGDEAILVDGANDAERLLAELRGLAVKAIVQTHGHFDHVQALKRLVDNLGVPVYAHGGDARSMPLATEPIGEGDELDVGGVAIRVLHTPGHTPGSLCLVAEPFLFSGDTLFPAGPGNTEGDSKRFAQIMTSLGRLFTLPDETRICPGHGLDSFIGRERPYVEIWRARGW